MSAGDLSAIVDLRLDFGGSYSFRLTGRGSRSLLCVFDGQQMGATAVTADAADLCLGTQYDGVRLTFWVEAARIVVSKGESSAVCYGDVVGHGVVRSVGWQSEGWALLRHLGEMMTLWRP